jgi:hypothetical protein
LARVLGVVEDIVEALSHHEKMSSRPSTAGSSHHSGDRPLSGKKLTQKAGEAGGNDSMGGTRKSSMVSQGSNVRSMMRRVTISEGGGQDDAKVMSKQGSVASMKVMSKQGSVWSMKSQASFQSLSKSQSSGKGEKASSGGGKNKGEIGVRRNTERDAETNALLGGNYDADGQLEALTVDDEVNPRP